jgi:UDPglucose 6-dehydrogenase
MSPAIELCQRLQKDGAHLRVYDPQAMAKSKAALPAATFCKHMNEVAEGCDALVIATEWDEFKELDLEKVRRDMTHPIVFDGRNMFEPDAMERLGFIYKSIGR